MLSIRNKILDPDWNRSANPAIAAAAISIVACNKTQGIESAPGYGYHEIITDFRVKHFRQRTAGCDRGSSEWDAARAAFAHRGRLFDSYYTIDITASREAGANYHPLDIT